MSDHDLEPVAKLGRPLRVLDESERRRVVACAALGLGVWHTAGRLGLDGKTLRAILDRDETVAADWWAGRAEAAEKLLGHLWEQSASGSTGAAQTLCKLLGFDPAGEPGESTPRAVQTVVFQIVTADGSTRPVRTVTPEDVEP